MNLLQSNNNAERNTKYLLDEHVLIYFDHKKKRERKKIFTNDKVNQSSLANRLITISLLIVIEPNRSLFFNIHCDFDFDFVRLFVRVCFLCQCAKYTAKLDVIFAYSSEGMKDENKKCTMFLLSLRAVAEKRES